MKTIMVLLKAFTLALLVTTQARAAAVFPIATNPAVVEFSGGTAYDGTNYFVMMEVGTNLVGQLFSTNGTLIGSQIVIGSNPGFPPAAALAFGKTNYLVAWSDSSIGSGVDMFGRFVSRAGANVGAKFPLLASQGAHGFQKVKALASDGTNFLTVWQDNNDNSFYGQMVTPSGTLSGSAFPISTQLQNGGDAAVTFGKTNFFVVWMSNDGIIGDQNKAFGELVSRSGVAGSPFQISEIIGTDQDPLAVAFDGTNFFAVWPWNPGPETGLVVTNWDLRGRIVSPDGTMPGSELDLVNDPGSEIFQTLAFDGTHYLLAWGETFYKSDLSPNPTNANIYFQYFDRAGTAVGSEFTVFTAHGTNVPVLPRNGLIYDGNRYAITAFSGTVVISGGNFAGFSTGDVYGAFITAAPQLTILPTATSVIVSWPTNNSGFTLQSTTNLALPVVWITNSPAPVVVGGQNTVTNATSGFQKYYRLIK